MMDRDTLLQEWGVSRETEAALDLYRTELEKWQRSINLIGPETVQDIWSRHLLDSLQMLPLLSDETQIVDLGSGAGFPGLALAIVLRHRPGAEVHLVESNSKKAAFLRHIALLTKAPVQVHQQRVEQVLPHLGQPRVITARALAPLTQLLRWCEPLLKSGSVGLFHKGRDLQMELEDAARYWEIDRTIIPSIVAPNSYILRIASIRSRNTGSGTDI
jgi:16S rRNA (guanine527-N7)-methyltransferase